MVGGEHAVRAERDKDALQALASSVTVTPESSSASMRFGLSVWSRPRIGSSFPAFAAETGSAKSGAVQCSPR